VFILLFFINLAMANHSAYYGARNRIKFSAPLFPSGISFRTGCYMRCTFQYGNTATRPLTSGPRPLGSPNISLSDTSLSTGPDRCGRFRILVRRTGESEPRTVLTAFVSSLSCRPVIFAYEICGSDCGECLYQSSGKFALKMEAAASSET
jgi:hypothetical protein